MMFATGFVKKIYFNDTAINGVKYRLDHHHHLHVEI